MPITLARNDPNNIDTEVQRWQYFLIRKGFADNRRVDGDFGAKTEDATRRFQIDHGLSPTIRLDFATIEVARTMGYTVLDRSHYTNPARQGDDWPPKPASLRSPPNSARNKHLTCFIFDQAPLGHRTTDTQDGIRVKGTCKGDLPDWTREFIMDIPLPDLPGAVGFPRKMRCHRKVAPFVDRLFKEWEAADLLHLIISYSGDYVPRYKRGKSPSAAGHGDKTSASVGLLSNHAYGSAFDVNRAENDFKKVPAFIGRKGCVRELVAIANEIGFFWGGHFSAGSRDGMHFEFADFERI